MDPRPPLQYVGDKDLLSVLAQESLEHSFVIFAGPTGAGKTTLESLVAKELERLGLVLRHFPKLSPRKLREEEILGKVAANQVSEPDFWKRVLNRRCLATTIVGHPDMYPEWPRLSERYGVSIPTAEELFSPDALPELLACFLIDDINQACREAEACKERLSVELSWRHARDWAWIFPHSQVISLEIAPWEAITRPKEKWPPSSVIYKARVLDSLASLEIYEQGGYEYSHLLAACVNRCLDQLPGNVQMVFSKIQAGFTPGGC